MAHFIKELSRKSLSKIYDFMPLDHSKRYPFMGRVILRNCDVNCSPRSLDTIVPFPLGYVQREAYENTP